MASFTTHAQRVTTTVTGGLASILIQSLAEPAASRGTVVFFHGLCEHAARPLGLGRWLAARGFRVVLPHLPGHGLPAHHAEAFGWLVRAYHGDEPEAVLATLAVHPQATRATRPVWLRDHLDRTAELTFGDLEAAGARLLAALVARNPGEPLILGGHSLGGLLATSLAGGWSRWGEQTPHGLLLLSPALAPRGRGAVVSLGVRASWTSRRGRWLAALRRQLDRLLLGAGLRERLARVDVRWASGHISDDPRECELHRRDPLIQEQVPASFLSQIEFGMARCRDRDLPPGTGLFLSAGFEDPIVDGRAALHYPARTERGAPELPARCQRWLLQNEGSHDLDRSCHRAELRRRVDAWLDAIIEEEVPGLHA